MARSVQEDGGIVCSHFINEPIVMYSTGKLNYTQETEIFIGQIDNKEMDDLIIKDIEEQGDKQEHKSNVKAQMTEWYRSKFPGYRKLTQIVLSAAIDSMHPNFNNPVMSDVWGSKYVSGEEAVQHHHYPAALSFCYYITGDDDHPAIHFPGFDRRYDIFPGMLILFPGWAQHFVPVQKFKNPRYIVAGNMHHNINKDMLFTVGVKK
ncbi:MAG: hypothetical protein H8E12_20800 [Rhodobacteraceae bacterium]|nr:hypothetical protein [Paracoccaceae bacterium]